MKEKLKISLKKSILFITNPKLLLCLGIAWLITNGWSYILLGIGTYWNVKWMIAIASGYLAFLWLPVSPEKIATVTIAIALLKFLFPNDKKTLAVLKQLYHKAKSVIKAKRRTRMTFKNVLIFGDSYSTFEGYIPEGYKTYYSETERSGTGVTAVEETWWHQLLSETNSTLIQNNSWSGSTVCYTGWDFEDCSETNSFIYRLKTLIDTQFFEEHPIDTVFVFGTTNDSWCDAPLGSLKFSDWEKEDLYEVLPAITYFFDMLRSALPSANIVCMINTDLKQEIDDALKTTCEHYQCHAISLSNINKESGHPTKKGMQEIKTQLLDYFNQL